MHLLLFILELFVLALLTQRFWDLIKVRPYVGAV